LKSEPQQRFSSAHPSLESY